MGLADALGAEDRVPVKMSELYTMMENQTIARIMKGAVAAGIPSDTIAEVIGMPVTPVAKATPGMTLEEYELAALRTSPDYETEQDQLNHAVFGLASEAGEVTGILQKVYQGHPMDKDHLAKELGDCLWMIAEACDAIGIPMEDVAKMNIEKLMERYPDGFDPEKSLHRKEGDV